MDASLSHQGFSLPSSLPSFVSKKTSEKMSLGEDKKKLKFSCMEYKEMFLIFQRLDLFIFKERGREKEKERKTSMCGCLLQAPYWGPGQQPRHVP